MLPLKKILCPTDFSDPSFEALNVAIELAVHFSSELILIHVVAPIPIIATEYTSPARSAACTEGLPNWVKG